MLTIRNNYYDLNLLDTSFRNSLILSINIRVSANKIDIQKNIYKKVLIKEQTEKNDKFNNLPSNGQIFSEIVALSRQLIPIISRDFFSEPGSSYFLDLLLLDSDFKTVCDHIYLLLLLNQLQHLTVEIILDHIIKNKENMFLHINQQQLIYVKE